MSCYLAIDGGGSKTLGLVADRQGHILGLGVGGGANVNLVPEAVAKQSVRDALEGAWGAARAACSSPTGLAPPVLAVMSGPIVGYVHEAISEITQASDLFHVREADAAWASVLPWLTRDYGLPPDVAVMIDAGTGSTVGGRRHDQRTGLGGWGWLLGDEGSGFWIGRQAVQAAIRATDGRGPPTQLVTTICSALGIEDLHRLIVLVYQGDGGYSLVGKLAPVVSRTAREGDPVALAILRAAAQELALMVNVIVQRLGIEAETFPVIPFGSVFKAGEALMEPFQAEVLSIAPHAVFVMPRYESVVGTLLLAMERDGVDLAAVWPQMEGALAKMPRLLVHRDERVVL